MFTNINHKNLSTVIAILVAIFTTGYLRIHWIPFLPESDGGLYTFFSQYFYTTLANGEVIAPSYPIALYSLLTSWVYELDINQYMALRWIDLCLAVIASTLFFPTKQVLPGIRNLTRAIQRTGLYERVAIISYSPNVYYKTIVGDIYRLKSFKQ